MDCPLVFELELDEIRQLTDYLFSRDVISLVTPATRLAQRGIPQGITHLVRHELLARGRLKDAESLEPFVVVGVK
jgi:hypothetical protein